MPNDPCTDSNGRQKKAWGREVAAEFVARQAARLDRCEMYWYECWACKKWHVTKSKTRNGTGIIDP